MKRSLVFSMNGAMCGMLAGLIVGWAPGGCLKAADEAPEGVVTLNGKIEVTQRKGLEPLAARLTTGDKRVYSLVMDERGKSLGRVMHREEAEIHVRVVERDGQPWAAVVGYVDPRLTAAHELWRRMRCNACVVFPGTVNAAPPKNLHGTLPVTGRFWCYQERFLAWTRDSRHLWLGSDSRLVQIDLATAGVVRSFGRAEGLPDQWVYQLASDGRRVWIVYKGGVAVLELDSGRIRDLPELRSAFAAVHLSGDSAWVMTDTGTFRYSGAGQAPDALPAIPTATQFRRVVEQGLWLPHWKRRTAHFLATPAVVGGTLYVNSYGDMYELAGKEWRQAVPQSWELTATADRIWFLTLNGLGELNPATGEIRTLAPPDMKAGRPARLMRAGDAIWMVTEPLPPADGQQPVGGGLSRLDLRSGQWQSWSEIGGRSAARISALGQDEGVVWAAAEEGAYKEKPAHPGMTYVKKWVFEAGRFVLHRFEGQPGAWQSLPLDIREMDRRLICGQDGTRAMDGIVPRAIPGIAPGPTRVFAMANLIPARFFGGFWPTVVQVAGRAGDSWTAGFEHHPEQLGLQGQQPKVLNISNGELIRNPLDVGQRVLEAVGHDGVLDLFVNQKRHWAVTDGGAGWFDEGAGRWRKIVDTAPRYYWHPNSAVEVGDSLYIGSDRGLVSRLKLDTGEFEVLQLLKDRSVVRVLAGEGGTVVAVTGQAPLGQLPVSLPGALPVMDADAAVLDKGTWTPLGKDGINLPTAEKGWFFRQLEKRNDFDKSLGNYLFDPAGQARYYLKEVFFPQFLCAGGDGSRLWIGTFDGLVRLDLGKGGPPAGKVEE